MSYLSPRSHKMDFSTTAMVAASLCLFLVTCAWKALDWLWLRPRKLERLLRQQGLSGNSYRLLFGDLIDNMRMRNEARFRPMGFSNDILSRVEPFLHQTIKNHGKNSFTWLGPMPAVIVSEPDSIREVFLRNNDFPRPHFNLVSLLMPGLVSYNGEKWAKHRKLINPAFHMEKLKLMLPTFYISCNEMIHRWEKTVPETGSLDLDVWPHLVNLTADIISRATFSSSYVEGKEAFDLIEEQAQAVFTSLKTSIIPGWRYVPTKANRRFYKVQKQIRSILRDIVETRMKEMEAGKELKNDLLRTLLESNIKETQRQGTKTRLGMTVDELIDECKLLYFAGQETTTALLAFSMVLLSRHLDWQDRARQEIMQIFGKNKPDVNGLSQLKIMTMVLYEVLRLYPPVTSIWRVVETNTKLRKLSLPAGVLLHVPVMSSHHDSHQWGGDATEFKPERFSEGISKAANENSVFFPFSMGPRICIGQNFALIEAKMALAMILQCFSLSVSLSYAHAPSRIVTIRPQFGARIVLHQL